VMVHTLDVACIFRNAMRAFGKHIQGEMANDSREVESFIQQHFTGVGRYQERALGARPPTCATSKASVVRVLSSMFDGVLAAQDASTHVDFVWAKLTLNKPYTWALATSVLHELKELGYHFCSSLWLPLIDATEMCIAPIVSAGSEHD
jgi:hypothetical protein